MILAKATAGRAGAARQIIAANLEVAEVIASERKEKGRAPRVFTDSEIVDRFMIAKISQAERVIEEGLVLRPADMDVVFLFGYGFPPAPWRAAASCRCHRHGGACPVDRFLCC